MPSLKDRIQKLLEEEESLRAHFVTCAVDQDLLKKLMAAKNTELEMPRGSRCQAGLYLAAQGLPAITKNFIQEDRVITNNPAGRSQSVTGCGTYKS